jgi:hypothetical protein
VRFAVRATDLQSMEELVQDHRAHGTSIVGVHSQLLRPRDLLGDDPIEQVPSQCAFIRGFHVSAR